MHKRSFTLFEILVVMVLIATALGAVSINISKAIAKEKFERGVERLRAKLFLAQELMLDFHTDVKVILKQEPKHLFCQIEAQRKIPEQLELSINRYSKIPGIESIHFDAGNVLYFDGNLGSTPQGT